MLISFSSPIENSCGEQSSKLRTLQNTKWQLGACDVGSRSHLYRYKQGDSLGLPLVSQGVSQAVPRQTYYYTASTRLLFLQTDQVALNSTGVEAGLYAVKAT